MRSKYFGQAISSYNFVASYCIEWDTLLSGKNHTLAYEYSLKAYN